MARKECSSGFFGTFVARKGCSSGFSGTLMARKGFSSGFLGTFVARKEGSSGFSGTFVARKGSSSGFSGTLMARKRGSSGFSGTFVARKSILVRIFRDAVYARQAFPGRCVRSSGFSGTLCTLVRLFRDVRGTGLTLVRSMNIHIFQSLEHTEYLSVVCPDKFILDKLS